MSSNKLFSVLTYNIGGYEIIHEIPESCINESIDYVYVTDNHEIKSDTWRVVYADDLCGSVFDRCYQIRFFPFKYVETGIVMRIDGSMSIRHDLFPMFACFTSNGYDAAVMIHPNRNTMRSEYEEWIGTRGYDTKQADRCLSFMECTLGYDVNSYKGLYQGGFVIQKNDAFNNSWNFMTYDMLKHLKPEGSTIERVDQTIWSAVLNTNFSYKKIMPVNQNILHGSFLLMNVHRTNYPCYVHNTVEPYMFNNPVETVI